MNTPATDTKTNTIIIEATASDFEALLNNQAPRDLKLVEESEIAPVEVLQMLSNLAADIRVHFSPSAWLIVENGMVAGLCSLHKIPENRTMHIGYGIAPTEQGKGIATRAIARLIEWAAHHPEITILSADTSPDNIASYRVLEHNGFTRMGERMDEEDGQVICWQRML